VAGVTDSPTRRPPLSGAAEEEEDSLDDEQAELLNFVADEAERRGHPSNIPIPEALFEECVREYARLKRARLS
jgi:hypothetical protein